MMIFCLLYSFLCILSQINCLPIFLYFTQMNLWWYPIRIPLEDNFFFFLFTKMNELSFSIILFPNMIEMNFVFNETFWMNFLNEKIQQYFSKNELFFNSNTPNLFQCNNTIEENKYHTRKYNLFQYIFYYISNIIYQFNFNFYFNFNY